MNAFDHITSASFISTDDEGLNAFAGFLRELELSESPVVADLAITADTHYKLYINGRFVNAGPAPFRRPIMRVDEYDIADYLSLGLNRVFVITRFIGADVKYNVKGAPGLIAAMVIDGATTLTDDQWKAFKIDAWRQDAPKVTWALPPMEFVDMASPSYGALSYYAHEDYTIGHPADEALRVPISAESPETIQFERRRVPLLHWEQPKAPLLKRIFRTNNEVHSLNDTPLKIDRERMEPAWDIEAYELLNISLPTLHRAIGEPGYALLYDTLRMTAGDFSVEIETDGPATIEIATAEQLIGGRPFVSRNGSYYLTRLLLSTGLNRYRLYAFNGFRYLFLLAKDFEGELKLNKISCHECSGDLNYQDRLELNDRVMSAIYEISRRSIQLTTQASYYDCNTREHGNYWGDGLWVTDMSGHMTGDFSHMREMCIAMTGEYQATGTLNSSLYGAGRPMVDYCMIAVEMMRRYAWYTADRKTVSSHLPTCKSIIADFRAAKGEGLVCLDKLKQLKPEPYKNAIIFLDHPGLGWHSRTTTGIRRCEPNAGLNLFYLLALQGMRELQEWLGEDSSAVDGEIQSLQRLLYERFFDPETGLIADSINGNDEKAGFSQIVNSLAVITGVLKSDAARRAMRIVVDIEQFPWVSQGTPYTYFYVVEALGQLGQSALSYTEMRNRWLPMVKDGATTTWETFLGENHDSLNHAWSAPLPYFVRRWLAGVCPQSHGYTSIDIRPDMSFRSKANIGIMIPQGNVEVGWESNPKGSIAVEVTLPEGVAGIFYNDDDSYTVDPGENRFTVESQNA